MKAKAFLEFWKWRWIYLLALPLAGCCLAQSMVYPVPDVEVPMVPPKPLEALRLPGGCMAWVMDGVNTKAPIVIWCHGNAENLELMYQGGTFGELQKRGFHAIGVDYPGYGLSAGRPSESGAVNAVMEALQEAKRRWPGSPRVLVGWSLGAAVACQASRLEAPDRLVLISPFSSLESVGKRHFNSLFVSCLMLCTADQYDSMSAVTGLSMPVLVVHGQRDAVIPIDEGRLLAARIPQARVLWIPEAEHNDILGYPEVWETLTAFAGDVTHP
ncbi:MAG: alpha/beta hydrolase [Planctomycetota bacterium]